MSESEGVKLSLRVVMNKEENKVLFAEVDNSFADVLLSFLTLPLGTIVRLLLKHKAEGAPIVGSLSTLYQGLANLDSSNFWTSKLMLLNPINLFEPQCRKLKLNIDDSEPIKGVEKCFCGGLLDTEVTLETTDSNDAGVFAKDKASFLISDDLQIVPNLAGSGIKILNDLEIRDIDGLKERTVVVGFKEILDLFEGSLVSRTPLTDLVLGRSQVISAAVKPDLVVSLGWITEEASSKRVIVKAFIQKATNRVILVEAEDDFVNFLFSPLTLPLVKVAAYFLKNKMFPLTENDQPALYVNREHPTQKCYLTNSASEEHSVTCRPVLFKDMNEKESGVKVPTFMVTDDLVVTPSSVMSGFSILTGLKIPLSDVEEQAFEIGSEEALSIIKACLTSTSALTNGLKPFMKGQLKQEK
ncbi:UNVERIFIED_CONTAM: hypothetical protein Slati_3285200 [Sesamum latifolium]|uniref:DUF674 family protein n=1 Tax=Sesamum latifolium TaxID=2727402 RepID=A0AAW2V0V0_9LAMI